MYITFNEEMFPRPGHIAGLLPDLSAGFPFPMDLPDLLAPLEKGSPFGAAGPLGLPGFGPLGGEGKGGKEGQVLKSLFGDLGHLASVAL